MPEFCRFPSIFSSTLVKPLNWTSNRSGPRWSRHLIEFPRVPMIGSHLIEIYWSCGYTRGIHRWGDVGLGFWNQGASLKCPIWYSKQIYFSSYPIPVQPVGLRALRFSSQGRQTTYDVWKTYPEIITQVFVVMTYPKILGLFSSTNTKYKDITVPYDYYSYRTKMSNINMGRWSRTCNVKGFIWSCAPS